MKADINVTPLIDVLLVLLIIFMCVAPAAPTALGAALPRTESPPGPPAPALVLEMRADELALNGAPVLTLEDLDRRLRAAFVARPDRTLFVKAADDVPYERVVAAMDVADHEIGHARCLVVMVLAFFRARLATAVECMAA